MKHTILVYGTLRPFTNTDVVLVPGYLYNLGHYPGIQLAGESETDSVVVCERITVDDEELTHLDQYEGCAYGYSDDNSLYTRQKIGEDWIYVYHLYGEPELFRNAKLIKSGDWQQHTGAKQRETA